MAAKKSKARKKRASKVEAGYLITLKACPANMATKQKFQLRGPMWIKNALIKHFRNMLALMISRFSPEIEFEIFPSDHPTNIGLILRYVPPRTTTEKDKFARAVGWITDSSLGIVSSIEVDPDGVSDLFEVIVDYTMYRASWSPTDSFE
jgi:hypothetical protein